MSQTSNTPVNDSATNTSYGRFGKALEGLGLEGRPSIAAICRCLSSLPSTLPKMAGTFGTRLGYANDSNRCRNLGTRTRSRPSSPSCFSEVTPSDSAIPRRQFKLLTHGAPDPFCGGGLTKPGGWKAIAGRGRSLRMPTVREGAGDESGRTRSQYKRTGTGGGYPKQRGQRI